MTCMPPPHGVRGMGSRLALSSRLVISLFLKAHFFRSEVPAVAKKQNACLPCRNQKRGYMRFKEYHGKEGAHERAERGVRPEPLLLYKREEVLLLLGSSAAE